MTATLTPTELRACRRRRTRSHLAVAAVLAVLAAGLWAASLMVGERLYTPDQVWRVILGETVPGASFTVGELRLPRATLALLAGLAYGAAGVSFQTLLRNQLASPDIIGISAGASAAGVFGIVLLGWPQPLVSGFALVAALGTAVTIYALSFKGGFAGTRLILIGIGVSAMLGSVVSWVLSKANQWDLATASRWLTGSLNGATWAQVLPLAVVCAVVLPVMWASSSQLATLRFGDDTASGLGVRVRSVRLWTIVGAVMLVAVATASCGPVAFVAFMAGPIAMRLSPSTPSLVLPASLVGAVIVLASDLVGQYLLGTRYPVGVITGALGAPFLVYLLVRANRARRS
ncbi:MAG: iron ABC transporter permease [Propionibacteriaceae bacterium]|nr:iron ABC transporter permease [Propionibacteriaceae bacterium]